MPSEFGNFVDLLGVVATFGVAAAGAYWANSYERQSRIRLADARRTAYADLWREMALASPTRLEAGDHRGPLQDNERRRLHRRLTDWYYRDGNGMLLPEPTRSVYLNAKKNLICPEDDLVPKDVLKMLPDEDRNDYPRGRLGIKQLSLLRTQMKADLAIYGLPYVETLAEHEKAFLRCSRVNLTDKAWSEAIRPDREAPACGPDDGPNLSRDTSVARSPRIREDQATKSDSLTSGSR